MKTRSQQGELLYGLEFVRKERKRLDLTSRMEKEGQNDYHRVAMNQEIEQLRQEIVRLRTVSDQQSERLSTLINNGNIGNVNVNNNNNRNEVDQLIRSLVDGLRVLNLDAKVPKFDGSGNPKQFLESLRKFFEIKNILANNQLGFVDGALEGRAKVWFDTKRNSFAGYDEFREQFLKDFYSVPIRVQFKSNWLSRRFESNKEGLNSYFLGQVKEAQYFEPAMKPYELHYTIAQQLPIRVREILSTVDYSDFGKVSNALSQLDLTFQDKTINSRKIHKKR